MAEKISPGTFDEEIEIEVTKILTSLLSRKAIANEFLIAKDPHLFAFMLNEIMQKVVNDYCYGEND